jgi:hypothetical protein
MTVAPAPTTQTLTTAHAQHLAGSAIADDIITERGYRSIPPGAAQAVKDLTAACSASFSDKLLRVVLHAGALAFPVYQLGKAEPYAIVLRPDLPRCDAAGRPVKYEYPARIPNVFDVLPRYRDALGDPNIPIWLTEGAKKADALASAFGSAIVPINLNGVYGWRGRNAAGGATALADFEWVAWEGRQVVIAPDGDIKENRQVLAAVRRLGRLLLARYSVAELLVCYLPQPRGAQKLGIDDYLAQGHTLADLDAHLVPLDRAASGARIAFGVHPATGEKLFLPLGCDVRDQTIVQIDDQGRMRKLYSGAIFVTETGEDIQTHEHAATVRWNGRGSQHGEITIPYAALSDGKAFSALAGAAGAALGPANLKPAMQFLVEFVQENREVLPHKAYTDDTHRPHRTGLPGRSRRYGGARGAPEPAG